MSQLPQLIEGPGTADTSPAQPHSVSEPPVTRPSLPQKRRGRPPGRPNTTVKDSDFETNPAVQLWNASKFDTAIPAIAINIREALPESFLTREFQRAIFKLPSRELIYFVQGWITSRQIASKRPSYVNGLLIHSRGEDSPTSCDQCAEKRGKHALGPFLTCRVLAGNFHDGCSNCKWFDTTSSCSLYTGPKPNRKRKAKGGGGDGAAIVDGVSDFPPIDAPVTLSPAQGQSELSVGIPLTDDVANGTDMSVLLTPEQHGDIHNDQENGIQKPTAVVQAT